MLEADRSLRLTPYWFGDKIGHADVIVACALRFASDAHSKWFDIQVWPALAAHIGRCEALPVFREIAQPFIPPA